MLSRHLHTLTRALVLSLLVVILSGAVQLGAPAGEPHRGLSGLVALLTLLTAGAAWSRPALRTLALGAVASVTALMALGFTMAGLPWMIVLHACISHLFFAATVALMVMSSPSQSVAREALADTGSPPLRTLALVVPMAVFLQIFLGSLYRHVNLPVWPHLVGSLLVGGLLLYTGMVVLESHGQQPDLRLAAQVLLGVTVAQLAFGMGAFLGRVMAQDHLSPEWWMVASRTIHVVTGALTLGAAVAYALQVNYHVQPGSKSHLVREKSAVA